MFKKLVYLVCCKILYHVKYIGLENLEKENRAIICPNHSNVFDPTFIYPKIENLYIMAKAELFKNKLLAKIFRSIGAFPVNREMRDTKSVLKALEVLKQSEKNSLLIFPEGKVIKKGETVGKVKNGAAFFAATVEIPIIPVYITRYPKLFSKVYVVIGKAERIPKDVLKNKEQLKESSKQLLEKIYQLENKIQKNTGNSTEKVI